MAKGNDTVVKTKLIENLQLNCGHYVRIDMILILNHEANIVEKHVNPKRIFTVNNQVKTLNHPISSSFGQISNTNKNKNKH